MPSAGIWERAQRAGWEAGLGPLLASVAGDLRTRELWNIVPPRRKDDFLLGLEVSPQCSTAVAEGFDRGVERTRWPFSRSVNAASPWAT